MKRLFSVIMVFILLFSQFGQSSLLGESIDEENYFELVIESALKGRAVINILSLNESLDSIELSFFEGYEFDENKTKDLINENIQVTYDEQNHKVSLERIDNSKELKANIILTGFLQEENLISARGNIDGEMTEFKEYTFNIPSEQLEKTEAVEEDQGAEKKEPKEKTESKNDEETEKVTKKEPKEKTESINDEETEKVTEEEPKEKTEKTMKKEPIITPFSGNINVDLDISPHRERVTSGNAAGYNLVLKVTGSRTEYTNAKIVVDLPITDYTVFTQDVSELVIDGVTPIYNADDHTLTYEFDSLKSGRTYETFIKVDTENGVSPNGEELTAKATFGAVEQDEITDDATVTIAASNAISVSKKYVETFSNLEVQKAPFPGSYTTWDIKVSIPKNDVGQMFIKEGSEIIVQDTFSSGLTYFSVMDGTPEPVRSGNTLTWKFDAPTLADQMEADGEFFTVDLRVRLQVGSNTNLVDTTQSNSVTATATFIDDITNNENAEDSIKIVDKDLATGTIDGTVYVPSHMSPSNGQGGFAGNEVKDLNPAVYDDANLGFRHSISPLPEGKDHDFIAYTTIYRIDENLILRELITPGNWQYRPTTAFEEGIPFPSDKEPKFNIIASVNGIERELVTDALGNHTYTRADLGIEKTDTVEYIKYDFTVAPSGISAGNFARYFFNVKSGFTGQVENTFNVYGTDHSDTNFNYRYHDEGPNTLAGPRHATVVPKPTDQPPIAKVEIELLEHESGEVIHGENRMKVQLNNTSSSTLAMQGQLETVVLLPLGVTLNDNPNPTYIDGDGRTDQGGDYEVISNDHNGSGRQLVKITWNDDRLRIGQTLAAELDVTISDGAPNSLQFDVYGFSGDEVLEVPATSGESITDTILQTDEEDLNDNGNEFQPRLKSGNEYFIRGEYNIQTEKLVKGELDEDYSLFGHTIPNGSIDYRLKLTNTTGTNISTMTLIDVLPSTGDLGITDNIERGSQFTPTLTGAIVFPEAWLDKVNVYYSTAKNPERDDLTRNTKYPESTKQLTNPAGAEDPNWMAAGEVTDWSAIHSFKIELQESATWITGEDITIEFAMQAPSETEVARNVLDDSIESTSRAAWNSFALATDHGQPVEPLRVGVYMDFDIEDPVVEKTVNNQKETVELENRDERFTWEVAYDFGNYTADWDSVVLRDQIHQLLDIGNVQVFDQVGEDVTENGEIDITDNLVTFTLNKQNDSFAYLKDQTYTLIIESFIKEDATDEDLEPFIQSGGIPNKAELIIDDIPEESNEVKVKPPVRGEIHLIKIDKETSEKLEGAEFELRKCENDSSNLEGCEVVETGITTADGKLAFEDLELGHYKLVETKAPEGYRLLTKPLDIEVTVDYRFIALEVENEKSGYMLPDTGGMGTQIFYLFGGLLMVSSLIYLVRKRKIS